MNLLSKARAMSHWLAKIRRQIHMWPELGMQEHRTAQLVEAHLGEMGIVPRRMAGTGVWALVRSGAPGKTVLLRADMDALPIQDRKTVTYASRVPGVMHACGHDAHVACLLGAARLLVESLPFPGNVIVLFQPAEEGPGGAEPMIREGAMDDPQVDACFGLHTETEMETGTVGVTFGPANAAVDTLEINVRGEGGHGAEPQRAVDAIVTSAHLVTALQSVVSREIGPLDSAVVTIGTINGGYRHNIIADEVRMTGTLRSLKPESREYLRNSVLRIAGNTAQAFRARCEVKLSPGYPSLVNDDAMTALVQAAASSLLGEDRVLVFNEPSMGAEDFSYYLEKAPGSFFKLGAGSSPASRYPAHHPLFDLDEACLPVGAAVLAKVALECLGVESQ
jgi:amidohydrolase